MAPAGKINIPPTLPYSLALEVCSDDDLKRLACAFLSANSKVDFDHHKAALEYGGPTAKGDSFKRQIWVITKKITEAAQKKGLLGDETGEGRAVATPKPAKGKGGGGRKRKAEAEGGEEGEEGGGAKKKRAKSVKKTAGERDGAADEDHAKVKAEGDGLEDGDEDYLR